MTRPIKSAINRRSKRKFDEFWFALLQTLFYLHSLEVSSASHRFAVVAMTRSELCAFFAAAFSSSGEAADHVSRPPIPLLARAPPRPPPFVIWLPFLLWCGGG